MVRIPENRIDFELYKSSICQYLKEIGDQQFINEISSGTVIEEYYHRQWYAEALYLLAMVDYICRVNNIPYCQKYKKLRNCKLQNIMYPSGILLLDDITGTAKQEAWYCCIPEFKRHNIVENEVRDIA